MNDFSNYEASLPVPPEFGLDNYGLPEDAFEPFSNEEPQPEVDPVVSEVTDQIVAPESEGPEAAVSSYPELGKATLTAINTSESANTDSETVLTKTYDENTGEVHVKSRATLADYEAITNPHDMRRLKDYAEQMRAENKKLVFVNATYAGGGVAIMRGPLIHLMQLLGVDARWYVLKPNDKAFEITKHKFHNVLQDVAPEGTKLTGRDKKVYEKWIKQNAKFLEQPLSEATDIVIDDWQPTGLIPYIKDNDKAPGFNPGANLFFRDHIQTEGEKMVTPGTPQNKTWRYIWEHNQVSRADLDMFHPREEFVPSNVPDEKVVYMPATLDLLDDLNRPLTQENNADDIKAGREFIDEQLRLSQLHKPKEAAPEVDWQQNPIDWNRPYIVLIARFDPSKGMPNSLEYYAKAREKMLASGLSEEQLPQLVVAGNGSVDDPDGKPELLRMMKLRSEEYEDIKDDIKITRLPANDLAINTLLTGASLSLQPSIKEGFEDRVSSAIIHGVPVLGSNRGGIPLQIVEGESGYVIDPEDADEWAEKISDLAIDSEKYTYMRQRTAELAVSKNYEFTTVYNAQNWLYLCLNAKKNFVGNKRLVREIATTKTQLAA